MPTDKITGIVQTTGFSPTYGFAVDDWGVWHHVHKKNISPLDRFGWSQVKPGSVLRFVSIPQGAGKYAALEVEVVKP